MERNGITEEEAIKQATREGLQRLARAQLRDYFYPSVETTYKIPEECEWIYPETVKAVAKKSYTIDTIIFELPSQKLVVATTELGNIIRFKDGNKGIYGYRCVRKDDVWEIIKNATGAVLVRSTLSGGKLTQNRLCFGRGRLIVDKADADYKMTDIGKGLHITYRGGSFGWAWFIQETNPIK